MSKIIRPSILADAPQFMEIKNQLPMSSVEDSTTTGGFLLGTNIKTYELFIQTALCLSVENAKTVVGFGIILPDVMVRQSELWEKRKLVNWAIDIEAIESQKICYFEQLAFLKGNGRYSLALAYSLLCKAFETHDILLTTTVQKPISNLAAVPYILAASGGIIGNIDEIYPEVGDINSNVYMIQKSKFLEQAKFSPYYRFLEARKLVW